MMAFSSCFPTISLILHSGYIDWSMEEEIELGNSIIPRILRARSLNVMNLSLYLYEVGEKRLRISWEKN